MCCFARPVRDVRRTSIFCRLSDSGTQLVTYQMEYATDEPNAMILPLPTRAGSMEDAVRFIDMSGYDQFFRHLNRGFPDRFPKPVAIASDAGATRSTAPLAVQEVGNFVASFVPGIEDFSRLDPRFVIPADVWAKIPGYEDFGFAVFQLEKLEGRPHPMALEFPTRFKDRVFFPTVHIHDGEVHRREHFDHRLYIQHPTMDQGDGEYTGIEDRATGFVRSKSPASQFMDVDQAQGIVDGNLWIHRKTMHGQLANQDVVVRPTAGVGDVSMGVPAMRTLLPIAATLLPIGWILHRRHLLRTGSSSPAGSGHGAS